MNGTNVQKTNLSLRFPNQTYMMRKCRVNFVTLYIKRDMK